MPLILLNECGVPKFVCTTLRPSLPSFPELYTLDGCAKFVSEFLTFEPLEDPLHPPKHVPSPMSVLSWQAADPFDAAVVLCSLLLGAGYNAYVAMGYAPLAVTLNDQSGAECPFWQDANGPAGPQTQQPTAVKTGSMANGASGPSTADRPSTAAASVANSAAARASVSEAAADEPGKRKKYQVRPKPQLASKFLEQHPEGAGNSTSTDGTGSLRQVGWVVPNN